MPRSDFWLASASAMAPLTDQNGSSSSASLQRLDALGVVQLPQRLGGLDAANHVGVVLELVAQQVSGPLEVQRLDEPRPLIEAHRKRAVRQRNVEGLLRLVQCHANRRQAGLGVGVVGVRRRRAPAP